MTDFDSLSTEWTVWNRSEARCVLVYRPDVFDADAFPAPCLPTIYLTHGRRSRRPGPRRAPGTEGAWYVTLFFEPEVGCDPERFETRAEAVTGAVELADSFADGEVDYRDQYQVPRADYLAKLDELTGGR